MIMILAHIALWEQNFRVLDLFTTIDGQSSRVGNNHLQNDNLRGCQKGFLGQCVTQAGCCGALTRPTRSVGLCARLGEEVIRQKREPLRLHLSCFLSAPYTDRQCSCLENLNTLQSVQIRGKALKRHRYSKRTVC